MAEHILVDLYHLDGVDIFPPTKASYPVELVSFETPNPVPQYGPSGIYLYGKVTVAPSGLNVHGKVIYTPATVTALNTAANA